MTDTPLKRGRKPAIWGKTKHICVPIVLEAQIKEIIRVFKETFKPPI